jgi:FixJ family two-component response regulator
VVFGPARTGTEVLALVASARITCAILDVMLRHEKVFQAARVLGWRGVGIVFHTGSGDVRELRREWPKAQVVTKPAPFELLLEAVMAASRENGLERKVKAAA